MVVATVKSAWWERGCEDQADMAGAAAAEKHGLLPFRSCARAHLPIHLSYLGYLTWGEEISPILLAGKVSLSAAKTETKTKARLARHSCPYPEGTHAHARARTHPHKHSRAILGSRRKMWAPHFSFGRPRILLSR